ncbi:MAG TPA: glycerol kinase GlpK [Acidimicrobiia bacterium]|nr:glycerol kinase GlpK [Acidimicrobiia bacterium]
MTSAYVGALDQGTTSTRFIIFDEQGRPLVTAQEEHRQIFPAPGWVEHDPMEIVDNSQRVIARALNDAGLTAADLAAVGITNQRETTVIWDRKTGRPLHNAIVWQDTRTADLCRALAGDEGQDRFRAKTGLPLATYFSGPKLAWLLRQDRDLEQRARQGELCFGTIDSWIVWSLSGGRHVTDPTNASRTMLMDLARVQWSEELCQAMGIPMEVLGEIVPSVGRIAAGEGPLRGVAISGILGDQQAALFGQTCFAPGTAKNTYGTGCFMLLNTGTTPVPSHQGLLTTVAYRIGEEPSVYALEGSIAITGALVQWLRDNLGMISTAAEVEELAASVEDNGDVYFVPAFSGLFAPHWRSDARGVIVGLTRFAGKGHIARAALEATAFQTREVLDAMRLDSGVELSELRVDGGMVVNQLLMQFQADLLGVPVIRPVVAETTALGAAYAAGLAEGVWGSTDDLAVHWAEERRFLPSIGADRRDWLNSRWRQAVERTLNWV